MGNQKQKWTAAEEEALLAGIAKYGPGKWKNILKEPVFAPFLIHRSNIDLKDKWRNLSNNNDGQGSKYKSRTPKVKTRTVQRPPNAQNSAIADGTANTKDDPLNNAVRVKNVPGYNAMIFDTLSTIEDLDGSDTSAIVHFIERKYLVPPNFRKVASTRLKRLASQGKLEKVQNCYRIRKDTLLGKRAPTQKQKDIRPLQLQRFKSTCAGTIEEAATSAACKVAEAEFKSFMAAEAVKVAESVSKMAEDNDQWSSL